MSCLNKNSSEGTGRAFCVITALFFLLILVILVFGLINRSERPEILGRYSISYALLLLGLFVVVAGLAWVFLKGSPRVRHWAGNLYVFLISALVVLLVVEWGLRKFNPFGVELFHTLPYHMQGMVDDPQLGYRHPRSVTYMLGKNRVTINTHGLRDEEIPYAKPDGEKRILVLGDSVAFGWGVSQGETFSDHLQALLREQTGDQWQVINAGVNGYNTQQEATYLRIEGMRYLPDYVLLIYVSNDADSVFDPNEVTWRRYPGWPPSLPEALGRLRQLSFLFQLTHLFTRMERMDLARAAASGDAARLSGGHSMTAHPNWQDSKMALLDIAQQCREAGIPFLVGLSGSSAGSLDSKVVAELRNAGIDTIRLYPAWQGVPASLSYVSRIDPHPSALLHEKIAEYLAEILRQRGWLNGSQERSD